MTTDDKQWQRLQALFTEALKQAEDVRETWVENTLADEPELKAELLRLLEHDSAETGVLSDSIAQASAEVKDSVIGDSIGAYRITGKIAEGGMGAVYVGEREGADFDQRVAIKLMHSHRFDAKAQERFVAERQILASLNHPNIAHLIDGGVTENGLPYIVMEYIDGENIADYCRTNRLSNEQILKLVTQVCGALQYAHNKLVIHRDIKPSNILVDATGAPRLLDFGIAKLLEQDGSINDQTRAEWRVLTPLYASPEQISSQAVSTASDVYGVGLLLYRLLTGQLPYTPTSDNPRDIEEAILSMPAELPSSAVTQSDSGDGARWAERQRKALRGDLDTILMTALRKEPERRYATVDALAEDLDRFLMQMPIRARGDTLGYRLRKFVDRNRLPVALTALLLSSAVGLTAFYTARINTEREVAEQTASFLTDLFVETNPYRRSREDLTVAELVTTGAEQVAEDASLDPLVRARLLVIIATVLNSVGDGDSAMPLALEAGRIYTEADNEEGRISALRVLASVEVQLGRYAEALTAIAEARGLAERVQGPRSLEVGQIACQASYAHYRLGDYDSAYEEATFALDIHEALLDLDDLDMRCPHQRLSGYYQITGNTRQALAHDAVVARLLAVNLGPDNLNRATLLYNMAISYTDLGDFSEAVRLLRESIDIRLRVAGREDRLLPLSMYTMAHATGKLGNYVEAHSLFNELLELQIEHTGDTHDTFAYWLNGHGDMLANLGATSMADAAFLRAMEIYEINDKPMDHFDVSVTLVGLGKVARDRGDLATAEDLMSEGLKIRINTIREAHSFTQLARVDLADVMLRRGRTDDARAAFDLALANLESTGDSQHPTAAQALTGLAEVEIAEGNAGVAIELLEQAIAMSEGSIGRDHLDNLNRRLLIANALELRGDSEEAEQIRVSAESLRAGIMAEWNAAIAAGTATP